jgi:hypothetical protein
VLAGLVNLVFFKNVSWGFYIFCFFNDFFYFRDKFKQFLESIDSDNEDRQDRNTGKKSKKHIYITNGNPLGGGGSGGGGGGGGGDGGGPPDNLYVTRREFIEFKIQIENRFDNLMKGYGKLEGKFDAFNQIWRQEIGDVKNEVHELSEKVDVINTNMSNGFTNMSDRFSSLENEIRNLAIRSS